MKPEADRVLNNSALQLLTQILPLLPAGYAKGTTSLIAVLATMAAQEYERGAEIRANENEDMRALFRDFASLAGDPALQQALTRAAGTRDTSLAISALDVANCELRRLLIALQMHVEEMPGAAAREAERRIWAVLKASAERRLVHVPAA